MAFLPVPLVILFLFQSHPLYAFLHPHRYRPTIAPHHATSDDNTSNHHPQRPPKVIIIGSGWAGFSAASTLSTSSSSPDVTLLDASPRTRGGLAGGWRTKNTNYPVEAGIHGFWRDYVNTFDIMERDVGLGLGDVLTDYTPSVLVSQKGRVALAPVLAASDEGEAATKGGMGSFPLPAVPGAAGWADGAVKAVAPLLPPPLDLALLSNFSSTVVSPLERASALNLLPHWADFRQEDRASWDRYDKLSAEDLFLDKAGVGKELYDELVSPLLHVLPMAPGYDISAAATLSCFHVFGLRTRGAFDVRWCRGPIAERIFDPWSEALLSRNVTIRGGAKVTSVVSSSRKDVDDSGNESPPLTVTLLDGEEMDCDAVIFAVGGPAMGRLAGAASSAVEAVAPALAKGFEKCRGVTCVAVRLFLSPSSKKTVMEDGTITSLPPVVANAMKDSPVFVCGPGVGSINELTETGFCIYDLNRLQEDVFPEEDVAVLEVDYFRADDLADLSDEEVVTLTIRAVSAALGVDSSSLREDSIVDTSVVRARNAVSHFDVGSASLSPPVRLSRGIYMCGDWVDRTGHASWSTEKAVVTGKQAAVALARDFGLTDVVDKTNVLDVPETRELGVLRRLAGLLREVIPPEGGGVPLSPWAKLRDTLLMR